MRGFCLCRNHFKMAENLVISWQDVAGFDRFNHAVHYMTSDIRRAASRAVNRTGDTARTAVRRTLAKQVGLKQKFIARQLNTRKSSADNLVYEISSTGKELPLNLFAARETTAGVSANPFGQRRVFSGTFMKGGKFPNRHGNVFHGYVVERQGKARFPIRVVKSGVIIPNEMVKGASREEFEKAVREVLPRRVAHELSRLGL